MALMKLGSTARVEGVASTSDSTDPPNDDEVDALRWVLAKAVFVVEPSPLPAGYMSAAGAATTDWLVCFATIPATTAPAAARMPRRFTALPCRRVASSARASTTASLLPVHNGRDV